MHCAVAAKKQVLGGVDLRAGSTPQRIDGGDEVRGGSWGSVDLRAGIADRSGLFDGRLFGWGDWDGRPLVDGMLSGWQESFEHSPHPPKPYWKKKVTDSRQESFEHFWFRFFSSNFVFGFFQLYGFGGEGKCSKLFC